MRPARHARPRSSRCDPDIQRTAIAEVAAQQAELPQVIGDVLADVGHGAVRAHDHLGIFIGSRPGLQPSVPARRITQQPLFFPSRSRYSTPRSFSCVEGQRPRSAGAESRSPAAGSRIRCPDAASSPDAGAIRRLKSYLPTAAVSFPPASMACSVSSRSCLRRSPFLPGHPRRRTIADTLA